MESGGSAGLLADGNWHLAPIVMDRTGNAYDQANRLTSATVAGVTESYAYDGDGVRFSRQVGAGPVTRYVSDVNTALPVTLDDGSRTYVWGIGLAYALSGSTLEVYHTDRLGSVRAITDASGAIIATYRSDEFGIPTATTGTSSQPFTFTGEPRDATGLSYLRARYYDATLGRFMGRDTWAGIGALPSSLNRHIYAGNNPGSHSDPSGQCVDPGGPGLRYCVDRFIPGSDALFGSAGDNRGPDASGGRFRIRQLIYQLEDGATAYESIAGITEVDWAFVHLENPGRLSKCDASAKKSIALGGRDIIVSCLGGHGVLWWLPGVPEIHHPVQIHEGEDGQASVVAALGTSFPSMEIWQYGGPDGPQLIYFSDASDNSEFDLSSSGVPVP